MRWLTRQKRNSGTIRYKTRFLIFPKRLGGEWRWLETAVWQQRWKDPSYVYESGYWLDARWVQPIGGVDA